KGISPTSIDAVGLGCRLQFTLPRRQSWLVAASKTKSVLCNAVWDRLKRQAGSARPRGTGIGKKAKIRDKGDRIVPLFPSAGCREKGTQPHFAAPSSRNS